VTGVDEPGLYIQTVSKKNSQPWQRPYACILAGAGERSSATLYCKPAAAQNSDIAKISGTRLPATTEPRITISDLQAEVEKHGHKEARSFPGTLVPSTIHGR
jgi:hypothetical protein